MSYQRVLDAIGRAEGIEKLFEGVKDPRGVESARAKATLRELMPCAPQCVKINL